MPTVVIVDDSPTARYVLRQTLESDPRIHVLGEAATSAEALKLIAAKRPQVVTMDVHLRNESGIDLTRRIMSEYPVPIVIVTGEGHRDPELAFRALSAGALDIRGKLPHVSHPQYELKSRQLIRTVCSLADVPVITQRRRAVPAATRSHGIASLPPVPPTALSVVALGASTGGPPVIQTILRKVPHPCPVPIVVVQHIAEGFTGGFAQWLCDTTGHKVEIVNRTTAMQPGVAYFAQEGRHIVQVGPASLAPSDLPARNFHRPSIEVYFESLARHVGSKAAAVLMTGMGVDGGRALVDLKRAGAAVVVQSPESCVVSSMPQSALALDATVAKLGPDELGTWVAGLVEPSKA